jgi:hypothetical protein
VLRPTVGCLTPGYCLFMPLDHIDAAADAAPRELAFVGAAAEEMRSLIIAEHGPRGCELGAGCCSHAHLHMIPVPDPGAVTAAYQATGGPGRRVDGLASLPGVVETMPPRRMISETFVRRVAVIAGGWLASSSPLSAR